MTTIVSATTAIRARGHRRTAATIGAPAVALCAMMVGAPVAHAISEATIKSDCAAAGGTYRTSLVGNPPTRWSECCYKDIHGDKYCDYYSNGTYESTGGPYRNAPPPGTEPSQPALPPGAVVTPGNPPVAVQ